jgi:photosystem II stability/assembly factor-like uncharacterized protein
MRLYKCILISALLLSTNAYSFDTVYWSRIPSPVTAQLYKGCYTDLLNIWAAGDSGVIVHSSDGGNSWVAQNSTIDVFISDIFFLNSNLGWAISNDYFYQGTIILSTTNGGLNWRAARYPDTSYIINTVYYLDSLIGFLAGYNSLILKTTDAGSNWKKTTIIPNLFSGFPIRNMIFYDYENGLACGGVMDIAGLIWKTIDGGLNWYIVDTTAEPLYSIKYYNYPRAYACGGDFEYGGSFSHSLNGGDSWNNRTTGLFGIAQAIAFRNAKECWVPLGFSRSWMCSFDSAKNWILMAAPDTSGIFDAFFIDGDHGWAFGQNGSILKYIVPIGINNNQSSVVTRFKLDQNYPNPFNPSTTINYQLPVASVVKITVFDLLGREVSVIVNKKQNAGTYKVEFNAESLGSGIYFYQFVSDGNVIDTKKMVYLK